MLNDEENLDHITMEWLKQYIDPKTGQIIVPSGDNTAGEQAAFQFMEEVYAAEADFLAHHHVRYIG